MEIWRKCRFSASRRFQKKTSFHSQKSRRIHAVSYNIAIWEATEIVTFTRVLLISKRWVTTNGRSIETKKLSKTWKRKFGYKRYFLTSPNFKTKFFLRRKFWEQLFLRIFLHFHFLLEPYISSNQCFSKILVVVLLIQKLKFWAFWGNCRRTKSSYFLFCLEEKKKKLILQ